MKSVASKREKEKQIVNIMIDLYAKGHCDEIEACIQLKEYANLRVDLCPMMEKKTFCSACKVHCYNHEKREKIIQVMRYSGPRMIFTHPILVIKHFIVERKGKND